MKNKIGIFILLIILSILSCKNEPQTAQHTQKPSPDSFNIARKVTIPPANAVRSDTTIKSAFDNPYKMAQNKYSHFDQILMRDLCKDLWRFDGGIDGSVMMDEKEMAGYWLKFFDDGRFEKGNYNKVRTKGKFTVDNLGFIEFNPLDNSESKSNYQAKFNNDLLILIGTPKYHDNNKQMKLSRISTRPKK